MTRAYLICILIFCPPNDSSEKCFRIVLQNQQNKNKIKIHWFSLQFQQYSQRLVDKDEYHVLVAEVNFIIL